MGFLGLFVHLFFHFSFCLYMANVKFFVKDFSGTTKTRSQAQVIEKPVFHSRDQVFHPIFMKFGLNVSFNNALEEYRIWVTWYQKWGHGIKSWKYPFYALLTQWRPHFWSNLQENWSKSSSA